MIDTIALADVTGQFIVIPYHLQQNKVLQKWRDFDLKHKKETTTYNLIVLQTELPYGALQIVNGNMSKEDAAMHGVEVLAFFDKIMHHDKMVDGLVDIVISQVETVDEVIALYRTKIPSITDYIDKRVRNLLDLTESDAIEMAEIMNSGQFVLTVDSYYWPLIGPQFVELFEELNIPLTYDHTIVSAYTHADQEYLDDYAPLGWNKLPTRYNSGASMYTKLWFNAIRGGNVQLAKHLLNGANKYALYELNKYDSYLDMDEDLLKSVGLEVSNENLILVGMPPFVPRHSSLDIAYKQYLNSHFNETDLIDRFDELRRARIEKQKRMNDDTVSVFVPRSARSLVEKQDEEDEWSASVLNDFRELRNKLPSGPMSSDDESMSSDDDMSSVDEDGNSYTRPLVQPRRYRDLSRSRRSSVASVSPEPPRSRAPRSRQ